MAGGNATHPLLTPLVPALRVPVRRFQANLAAVLRRVRADGEYGVLTRRGAALGGVVPVGALDLLVAAGASLRGGTRVPVRRFRRDLPAVLRQVRDDRAYVVLTRRGVPVAAVVPVAVLDQLDAVDSTFTERAVAASHDLHDLEAAAPDVAPRTDSATAPPRRSHRPPVPRLE